MLRMYKNGNYHWNKKFVCLDEYPGTDYDLIKEAGVEIDILDKTKIEKWAAKLITKNE